MVLGVGVEPTCLFEAKDFKSFVSNQFHHPSVLYISETQAGIEPAYNSFADCRVYLLRHWAVSN